MNDDWGVSERLKIQIVANTEEVYLQKKRTYT